MLEAVIFDMDGVIVDSEPGYLVAMNRVLARYDKSITAEFHDRIKGYAPIYTWEMILAEVGLEGESPEELADEMMRVREDIFDTEGCRAIPGTIGLMKKLARENIKMAVASSAPRAKIDRVMRELEIGEYLEASVSGSEECENCKPDPEIFLKAAKGLGVRPADCVVIEDGTPGIKAAKRAGMHAIRLFASPGQLSNHEADLVVKRMDQIRLDTLRGLTEEQETL